MQTTTDLLNMKTRQLQRREKNMNEIIFHFERMKKKLDNNRCFCNVDLRKNDMILVHDIFCFIDKKLIINLQ